MAIMSCCLKKDLILLLFVGISFSSSFHLSGKNNQPGVTIPQGILQGKILTTTPSNRSISAFLGIPYAQPPTGKLRFANPVAAGGWNGIRDASFDSNQCPQVSFSSGEIFGDEDCLYLNVYKPKLPKNPTSRLLPVMVFVHGGAFSVGSDISSVYGPEYLLEKDVVLVTLNHRLGALGYLSTGDAVASGNWGLKDQVLALKWVQTNIKYFGGDPDQVTLFGESSGAVSVHLLTMTDITIGLFHRYITESGSALATWAYRPSGPYAGRAFDLGKYVGCSNKSTDSLIECLRTVDIVDILGSSSKFNIWKSYPAIVWGPTDEPNIDGAILTDSPQDLIRDGRIQDLPRITGVCHDEGLVDSIAFYQNKSMVDDFLANFDLALPVLLNWLYSPNSGAAWVEPVKSYYFNDFEADKKVILANLTVVIGDVLFMYPVHDALRQQFATTKSPQYFYHLNYRGLLSSSYLFTGSTANYGVAHGDDLVYLFPNTAAFSSLNETRSKNDYKMVNIMTELWTSFAIEGKPTTSAFGCDTKWEPFSITKDNDLSIGNKSDLALTVEYSYFKKRLQFWDDLKANVPL
ncbi:esterase E4-like [Diprion similis]|uniref:esterase E4-like n=1 Tax=Diprion similis TaxID=362088 RepID=UPI001EF75F82|nr:esterase E4-like [Diprion similis]